MKKLNQKAEAIFRALIETAKDSGHSKIDNGGAAIMAVCVEKLDTINKEILKGNVWSIAHYYVQEGDMCNDPEMTFLETPRGIFPLSFEMQGSMLARYEVSVDIYAERPTMKPRMQKDHTTFANQWMLNIKSQQGIKIGGKEPSQAPKVLQLPTSQPSAKKPAEGLEWVEYSEMSFAIFGDKTKEFKDELFKLGGKFNRFLKRNGQAQAGWIFSKKREQDVKNYFQFN